MKSIILAGGSGSRLWPLSRDMYPKQIFNLDDNESLLQQTFSRIVSLVKPCDIVTVTNVKHSQDIKLQLNKISPSNIVISEPISLNTAPAIACALEYFQQKDSQDDIIIILPSDHLINDMEAFNKSILSAQALAQQGYIVTFGVKPTYAETGYGYIKTNGFKVEKFVEKPDLETVEAYIKDESYYWNSGIFMGKLSTFLAEFATYAPEILSQAEKTDFSKETKIPYSVYENLDSISVDYAVMEKSNKLALVELCSDWMDLGSWQSLYSVKDKDEDGNVLTGHVVVNNVKNSLIYSQKELVAVSDLENIILIETEDAIMACRMDQAQNVKYLYDKLKQSESDTVKLHKTVFRPWGYYTCMNSGEGYLTKTICVMPKQKLSIQSHNYRSEHWVVLEGTALVILDGKEHIVKSGDSIDIPLQAKHSLQNPYDEELKVIEVQKGTYISEDDIIRYEDCYGRV